MLPRSRRLVDGSGFTAAVRGGRRAGTRLLVVHYAAAPGEQPGPRVGFVVSRAVGDAVARNRVKRRLRHLLRDRIASLPPGILVVRAQPAAAGASWRELGDAVDRCLSRVVGEEQR